MLSNIFETIPVLGCALPKEKKFKKFGTHVVEYLQELYNRGVVDGGKKARSCDVERDMRRIRDAKGKFKFMPKDWLTENQIKSYFSTMTSKLRKKHLIEQERSKSTLPNLLSPTKKQKKDISIDDIEVTEEDIEDEISQADASREALEIQEICENFYEEEDDLQSCPLKVCIK